jgi:hypothetical protein
VLCSVAVPAVPSKGELAYSNIAGTSEDFSQEPGQVVPIPTLYWFQEQVVLKEKLSFDFI